ncbi:hypothetical protein ABZ362_26495 [Streptomyces sp. NPDC005951]|uniref:hypothetical protein n=1 Tax=Streptomyces sp. NPDC005951 TaxID=3154573 RepID=UPI0033CC3D6E
MTRTHTPWPTGVVARYLTDAGKALADPTITVDLTEDPQDTGNGVLGICQGCETPFPNSQYLLCDRDTARAWAQEHAQTCRALPMPAGAIDA